MYSFRSWGPPPASRASRLPRARSSMLCSSGVPGEVISVVHAYIIFFKPQIELLTNCTCIVHWSVMRRSRKTPHALSSGDLVDHSTRPITALMAA